MRRIYKRAVGPQVRIFSRLTLSWPVFHLFVSVFFVHIRSFINLIIPPLRKHFSCTSFKLDIPLLTSDMFWQKTLHLLGVLMLLETLHPSHLSAKTSRPLKMSPHLLDVLPTILPKNLAGIRTYELHTLHVSECIHYPHRPSDFS